MSLSFTFCKYFFAEVLVFLLVEEPESVSSSEEDSGLGVGFIFFLGNFIFFDGFPEEPALPEVEVTLLRFLGNLFFIGFLEELEFSSSFSISPNLLLGDFSKHPSLVFLQACHHQNPPERLKHSV